MSELRYVRRSDGRAALPDDMAPAVRAISMLVEHANARQDAGLPLPCRCAECRRHRESMVCSYSEDGLSVVIRVRP
jgi:hypothetical protein